MNKVIAVIELFLFIFSSTFVLLLGFVLRVLEWIMLCVTTVLALVRNKIGDIGISTCKEMKADWAKAFGWKGKES